MSECTASITCTTASGKTLQELSRLIELRTKRLGELTEDAVIATAIDVLVSLRSDTSDARKTGGKYPPKSIIPRRDLFISFRDGHIPCLRQGNPHGEQFHGGSFYLPGKGVDLKTCSVFRIAPCHERIKPYFVAAPSAADALKFEARMQKRGIERKGGLAKTALGVAMAKISTRNADDHSPKAARILASKLSHITVTGSGVLGGKGTFGLEYRDELNYAIPALKSGKSGVETAMQKAANKIAGMITHSAHVNGDFEHDVKTPFPDIKRRK